MSATARERLTITKTGYAPAKRVTNERWLAGGYHYTYAHGFAGVVATDDGRVLKCEHVHKTTEAALACTKRHGAQYTIEI